MKIRLFAAILALLLLSGCAQTQESTETMEAIVTTEETGQSEVEFTQPESAESGDPEASTEEPTESSVEESANPYAEMSLFELLPLMPLDGEVPEDLKIGMQRALMSYEYMLASQFDLHGAKLLPNYNYLQTEGEKASFVWFHMVTDPDGMGAEGILWDAMADGTMASGAAGIYGDSYSRCYEALLGETVDINTLAGLEISGYNDAKFTVKEGIVYGCFPTDGQPTAAIRDPRLSYDASTGEYVLSTAYLLRQTESEYPDYYYAGTTVDPWNYEETEYPQEEVFGTLTFRLTETNHGYCFQSIVITQP